MLPPLPPSMLERVLEVRSSWSSSSSAPPDNVVPLVPRRRTATRRCPQTGRARERRSRQSHRRWRCRPQGRPTPVPGHPRRKPGPNGGSRGHSCSPALGLSRAPMVAVSRVPRPRRMGGYSGRGTRRRRTAARPPSRDDGRAAGPCARAAPHGQPSHLFSVRRARRVTGLLQSAPSARPTSWPSSAGWPPRCATGDVMVSLRMLAAGSGTATANSPSPFCRVPGNVRSRHLSPPCRRAATQYRRCMRTGLGGRDRRAPYGELSVFRSGLPSWDDLGVRTRWSALSMLTTVPSSSSPSARGSAASPRVHAHASTQ